MKFSCMLNLNSTGTKSLLPSKKMLSSTTLWVGYETLRIPSLIHLPNEVTAGCEHVLQQSRGKECQAGETRIPERTFTYLT